MDNAVISQAIRAAIQKNPADTGAYSDLYALCRAWEKDDFAAAHGANRRLTALCSAQILKGGSETTA